MHKDVDDDNNDKADREAADGSGTESHDTAGEIGDHLGTCDQKGCAPEEVLHTKGGYEGVRQVKSGQQCAVDQADESAYFLGFLVHGSIIQETHRSFFPFIDKDIVRDAQELLDVQFLVNAGDSCRRRFIRVMEGHLLSFDIDLAFIGFVNTGEDFDQCRLACAVLADQAENLAGLYRELHLVKCLNPRKYLDLSSGLAH